MGVEEGDFDGVGVAIALIINLNAVAGVEAAEFFHHFGEGVDLDACDAEDDVALAYAGAVGGAVVGDLGYVEALDGACAGLACHLGVDLGDMEAEVAALHIAVVLEVGGHLNR